MTQSVPRPPDVPRYRLLDRIGSCGATESFLALIDGVGGSPKRVVVDRLWPQLERDPHFLAVFLDEARLSLRLKHPTVVQSYEIGWQDDAYYLASEYIEGQSLESLIGGPAFPLGLELPLSLEILLRVLGVLEYAHDLTDHGAPLGIVHRRVSPANVLITYGGAIKLARFGVAQTVAAERRAEAGVPEPSLHYVAPEQLRGAVVDRRADLYSVGVMLWELAAGRPLWAGFSEEKLAYWLRHGNPAPALRGDGIPPELAPVAARALAMDPRDRYATASEFQADLAQVLTVAPLSRTQQLGALAQRVLDQTLVEPSSRHTPPPASPPPSGERRRMAAPPRKTPRPSVSPPPVPAALVEMARHTPLALSAVDDDAATRVRLPPRLSPPTAWWPGGALLVLAVVVIAVATGRGSSSVPVTPADPPSITTESIEPPVVEPLSEPRAAGTAPRPAPPPARPSNSRGHRKPMAATAATRSARRRASAADRRARNAAAGEASEALALGQQALLAGELRLAEQDLRRAVLFDPANGEALAALAEVRFERARYKDALLLAERAVHSAPDNPKYLVLLGDVSFKLGLEADAAAAYARARVMRPDDAEIRARFDRVAGPTADAQ